MLYLKPSHVVDLSEQRRVRWMTRHTVSSIIAGSLEKISELEKLSEWMDFWR